jgi:O-antigen/teichoic acid export membrane protein
VSGQPSVKRNMVWNTAGLGVEIISGFILLPLLLNRLGEATYGVWVILGAVASYFTLVELGVRGSVGRFVAYYHSQHNQLALLRTVNSGLLMLIVMGSLSVVVLLIGEPIFFRVYEIPESEHRLVSLTYLAVTAHFFVSLTGTAFDATLWGHQRFDWLNAVDIPVLLLRVFLIYFFVRTDSDLLTLALIMLGLAGASALGKLSLCFVANPSFRIGPRYLTRDSLREILNFGTLNTIMVLSRLTRTQLAPLIIGSLLGIIFVPAFSIASRLAQAVFSAMQAITGVLTPHATALHATNQEERQRHLFLVGGLHCATLTSFFVGALLAIGDVIIDVWVGSKFNSAELILAAILFGELLPFMQFITIAMLYAKALHRSLAICSILEAVAVGVALVAFIPLWGLFGASLAIAVPAFVARGLVPLIQGCRVFQVPIRNYVLSVIVPATICLVVPTVALRLVTPLVPSHNWWTLIGFGMAYVLCFGLCYLVVLGPKEFLKLYRTFRPV